jgi:hypothetical protein
VGLKKQTSWYNGRTLWPAKKAPPLFARWTNDDDERMNGLMTESIDIAYMHYGQHATLRERELEAALDSMSWYKRNEL